jgi:hypothetical protein
LLSALAIPLVACEGSSDSTDGSGGQVDAGGAATGGATGTGGTTAAASGGAGVTGGVASTGGISASGGTPSTGGSSATGGTPSTGGSSATGGSTATGGRSPTGGRTGRGGAAGTGGTAAGGAAPSGGITGSGGSTSTGGSAAGGGGGGSSAGGSTGSGGSTGGAVPSAGCGKTPTLKNSPSSSDLPENTVTAGGKSRVFILRRPEDYDNNHPYRLILDLHGAGGSDKDHSRDDYCGLWPLSKGSTIFVALGADGGYWNATSDLTYVDEVLKAVEGDLCIDTSRVMLEGFSQGAAMLAVLGCSRPGVFRALVGHSRGGVTAPTECDPIPYFGSLGLSDIMPNSQETQTDPFAEWNGCTIEALPTAPSGGHVCTPYKGCPADKPVIWCSYDGGHDYRPKDAGQSSSWMPAEVWPFFSQF